jgi:hypothetical protein
MTTQPAPTNPQNNEKKDNKLRLVLLLAFLFLSALCVFCSSQGALFFVDREKILGSMRSIQQADYAPDVPIIFSQLDRDKIIAELFSDEVALQQIPEGIVAGPGIVIAQLPKITPQPTPTAIVLAPTPSPTLTPSPTPTPEQSEPPSEPSSPPSEPTNPPPTAPPPTAPPPTVPLPSPTAPPPTVPPPTAPPPTSPPPAPTNTPPPGGGSNNPPQVGNDGAVTNEDNAVIIAVLANDSDPDGALVPSTVAVISGPANGSVVVNPATGAVTYTPNLNFSGTDTFTYQVCDNGSACSTGIVTVTVNPINDPPIAVDDLPATNEDTAITITVLANDSDPDFDSLSVISAGAPASGTVVINPDFTVTYTPTTSFTGTDVFTYTISDGLLTDTATVTVTVNPVNDPPVAVDDTAITSEDTAITITVLANDSDPESDPLSVIAASTPTTGTVVINAPPTYTITYTPPSDFNGVITFTYTISDGNATATATVTVTVSAVNDPPVAVDDTATTNQDVAVVIDVLANDSDSDGSLDPASVITVTNPTSASVTINGGTGEITYTPNPGAAGVDIFDYQVCDTGTPLPSACSTATITVTVVDTTPDPPTNLQAAAGDSQISLGWLHTPPADLVGYRVYRSDVGLISTTTVITRYLDTGLTNSVTYVYTVTAIDIGGNESGPSNSASATPGAIITNTTTVTCGGNTVVNCANAGGPRDTAIATITGTGVITFDFGAGEGIIDGPSWDLVFYEFYDAAASPNRVYLDFVTIQLSVDGVTWYTIFEWDGDSGATSDVRGTSIDSIATDANGEQQDEQVPSNLLYPQFAGGTTDSGIAIDIGNVLLPPPAGQKYQYVRITYPTNGTDIGQVDAIERLN